MTDELYQQIWQAWAEEIHRRRVQNEAAQFIEALAPVIFLGAQLIYMAKPLLGRAIQIDQLLAAAKLMEDARHVEIFREMLLEDSIL